MRTARLLLVLTLPNALASLVVPCQIPALMLVSERGTLGEFDVELLGRWRFSGGAGAGEPVGEEFAGLAFGFEGFEEGAGGGRDRQVRRPETRVGPSRLAS